MSDLELWGGLECTVNRVGDDYRDQFADSGHHGRLSDLDRVAELGIRTLRYPVLWEHVSPDHPDQLDWDCHDARLGKLRDLGIGVIAGLVHHGSGPRYTDLLSPDFAPGLARHARRVAERYDWIEDWTPVNEPVTTARFSALYGHWYPHHREEGSFWLALLNQVDGVRLAMREVRRINPGARLIQTDDLGRTYATAALREQAAFDNARRWMGWDLLCGRVTPKHMLWQRLRDFGLEDRLRAIADDPCPPDIIGINHYLTSDRFLDHRIDLYPETVRGSNGIRPFVDVEGVRALQPAPAGLSGVLREAWERYGIPLAVTEVHNGSTREEQLRWTLQAWRTAQALRAEGMDLRAITSWALFGSCGWNTLLTAPGNYEAGAFDVRGGTPRPTALAGLLRTLAGQGDEPLHPVLAGQGWWTRPIRLHHAPIPRPAPMREHVARHHAVGDAPLPILIMGGGSMLGGALAATCRHRDLHHVAPRDLDLGSSAAMTDALDHHRPWVVIDATEAGAADSLYRLCGERGIPTIRFRSDLGPDAEPVAERSIGHPPAKHLVIRTGAFFSPFDPNNVPMQIVAGLREGKAQRVASDELALPTYVPDLCEAVLDLAIDGETGLWHLSNGEVIDWAEFARRIAAACDLDPALIVPVPGAELGRLSQPSLPAPGDERDQLLPPLIDAIARFARELGRSGAGATQTARTA